MGNRERCRYRNEELLREMKICASAAWHDRIATTAQKGVLYEQVPAVNLFSFIRVVAFAVVVAVDVALDRVCIRTPMSRMRTGLGAGWDSRAESMTA